MLGLGSDTECNSREEPSTLHLVKVHRKSRTDGDVMSEGPPKCKQSPRIVVDAYLSVGMRSSELMGLQIRPSVRPAGSFPCSRQMEVLTARLCTFHCWVATAICDAEQLPPPTQPTHPASPPPQRLADMGQRWTAAPLRSPPHSSHCGSAALSSHHTTTAHLRYSGPSSACAFRPCK